MMIQTGITTFGLFFIPVTFIWVIFYSKHLIPLLVFASIFQAASIFNFGSFAIMPYYFISIIIMIKFFLSLSLLHKIYIDNLDIKRIVIALSIFLGWGLISAITLPFIFEGILVFSPRGGIDEQYVQQAELLWSISNLAQVVYLFLNIVNVIAFIQYVRNKENKKLALNSFLITAYIAIFFVLYHSISKFMQIPFPIDFLYSNPFYAQGYEQTVGNLLRANGTFTEPSLAGTYLVGIAYAFFAYSLNKTISQKLFIFSMAFFALLVTTASTGYMTFLIMLCIYMVLQLLNIYKLRFKINTILIYMSIFIFSLGIISIIIINFNLLPAIESLTTSKGESDSFKHRLFSDIFALNIFIETYGLGVGLGSNRPSSYITSLLSNLGIIGAGISFYMMYVISKLAFTYRTYEEVKFFFFIFLSILISQILSIPDLTTPMFWVALGYLLAYINYFSQLTDKKTHQEFNEDSI